jgi:hypothetical protein
MKGVIYMETFLKTVKDSRPLNGYSGEEFYSLPRVENLLKSIQPKSDPPQVKKKGLIPHHQIKSSESIRKLGDIVINIPLENSGHFTLLVKDNSMEGAGIRNGDYIVVEKNEKYSAGGILVIKLKGEIMIRRYFHAVRLVLLECDPHVKRTLIFEENMPDFEILGRVVQVVRTIQ